MRKGIMVAGSILVDKINQIEKFPKSGELTQIKSISKAVGGCVPNDAIDIKTIAPDIDVYASGKIGLDEEGNFVLETFKKFNVDTENIVISKTEKTSFTDVMSIAGGERTFFTYAGASSTFGESDINFENCNAKMLHLGYFLLLDKIDNGDGVKILKKAKEFGIKTSIDLVTENSDRYSLILPCLPYVDNLIVNEIEGGRLSGIAPTENNVKEIAQKLKQLGVKERVIIHMPHKGVCLSNDGYVEVNSYNLPSDFIKGSTGAGDAFCSGSLVGIYKGYSDKEILEFGSMCAVVSLRVPDAISGMMQEKDIKTFCKAFSRR